MITTQCYPRVIVKLFGEAMVIIYMVIEQQVDGEIDAQVGRGVWQGGAGLLWSVGGGVCSGGLEIGLAMRLRTHAVHVDVARMRICESQCACKNLDANQPHTEEK